MPITRSATRLCAPFLALVGLATSAEAAVYCVETPGQLQAALTAAAASADDDEIRLRSGDYLHTFALDYYGQHPDALHISGGWTSFQGTPCGVQQADARLTRLDGGGDHQIMRLESFGQGQPGQAARYTVSNLHFDNGFGQGYIYGGGLHMKNMSLLPAHYSVDNVIFTRNKAMAGGALHLYTSGGSLRITGSVFDDNVSSTQDMGHLYAIVGGSAGSTMHIASSTFGRGRCHPGSSSHRCGAVVQMGSFAHLDVRNTLFWDNSHSDLHIETYGIDVAGASARLERTLAVVTGTIAPEIVTPLSGDPLFTDVMNGDYRLLDTSPVINQGSPMEPPGGLLAFDVAGKPRVRFGRIDPGALENQTADQLFADGFQSP